MFEMSEQLISHSMTGGVLNINKPSGLTSFQVVKVVRKVLKTRQVGHCGTLDPMANGVLLVVFGNGTSHSKDLMSVEKCYRGEMRLGIKTDSGDITGRVVETIVPPIFERNVLERVFKKFTGERDQIPPMFSAVKWKGRKLYEYARKGIEVLRPARKVTVFSLELLQLQHPFATFRIVCSKGTYVRRLVEEIGELLGVPATLSSLTRERCGDFLLENSLSWNDLLKMNRQKLLSKSVILDPCHQKINVPLTSHPHLTASAHSESAFGCSQTCLPQGEKNRLGG